MRYKIAKTGIGAGIGMMIIGGVAVAFRLWFDFLLPPGFLILASSLISMLWGPKK